MKIDTIYDVYVPRLRREVHDVLQLPVVTSEDMHVVKAAAHATILKSAENFLDAYDVNTYAERYARNRSMARVTEINDHATEVLQRTLAKGIREGLSDQEIAALMKSKVGLTTKMAQAVDNYRDGLVKKGMAKGEASAAARRYAADLRLSRATAIAQTEVAAAFNAAKHIVWKEAVLAGDMSESAKRKFVIHPTERTCGVCKSLHGRTVPMDTGRYKAQGVSFFNPPIHPHCRCTEEAVDGQGKVISKFRSM